MGRIGVVSDMHLKESLGYADYIPDRREKEKKEVLEFIRKTAVERGCDRVVLLGDMLNSRNNPSSVIREYVAFLESFGSDVQLYVVAGNHEKHADGRSAIDFLKEIKGKDNWNIVTGGITYADELMVLPYMHKEELEMSDAKEASKKLMETICGKPSDILFAHHCISGTSTDWGQLVDLFDEPVLDREELEKHFKLIIGGHIHAEQSKGNTYVVGSVFANDAGEGEKRMLIVDDETFEVESVRLPGRQIVKLDNPTCEEKLPKSAIVRAVVTKRTSEKRMEEIREWLRKFDAHILVDMRNRSKKRAKRIEGGIEGLSVERLLELWAKETDNDPKVVLSAFNSVSK